MFRLALALGRTVEELGRELSSAEFTEWLAFYELEPFGQTWHQTATAAAVTHNAGVLAATAGGADLGEDALAEVDDYLPVAPDECEQEGGRRIDPATDAILMRHRYG
jgi:hypothetical protein